MKLKDRLAFALDVPPNEAQAQIDLLGRTVGWVKTNFAFVGGGKKLLHAIDETGAKIFLDLKWKDIPNTIEGYVMNAMSELPGLGMFNLHADGGGPMLEKAVQTAEEMSKKTGKTKPLVIAVTVLTSMNPLQFRKTGHIGSISEQVLLLADLAKKSGCDGVVSSPQEAAELKKYFGDQFLSVTPGVRFEEEAADDQERLASPRIAVRNGSDILVMGRSLIRGGKAAVERAYQEIYEGLLERLDLLLYRAKAFQFGSFQLKHHEVYKDAPLSPYYISIRKMPGSVYRLMADIFLIQVERTGLEFDYIIGVPKAGDPIAEELGKLVGKPVLHLDKIEGEEARKIGSKIKEPFEKGKKALLVDDLITKALSKEEACQSAEENGLEVAGIVVGYDREEKGVEQLQEQGRKIIAVRKWSKTVDFFAGEKLITPVQVEEIGSYKERAEAYMKSKVAPVA